MRTPAARPPASFRSAALHDFGSGLLPVVAIEQLDRQEAAEPDRIESSHQFVERGDAVAGVDAVRIVDLRARRRCPGSR